MKKLIAALTLGLLLACSLGFGQTHTEVTLEDAQTITGAKTISGTLGIYNHNGIFWAGSQATPGTPTIATAEASAVAAVQCRFDISPQYSGGESVNLFTTSMGYNVYAPPTPCFAYDNRQNVATPGNPGAAPLYTELVMARAAGELTAVGVNLWPASFGNPIPDSTASAASYSWLGSVSGVSLPATGGDQFGATGVISITDKVNPNGSPSNLIGIDGECNLNNTSQGAGTFAGCWGATFGAHITRAGSVGHVAVAGAAHFFGFGNISSSGGGADKLYTIMVEPPGTTLAGGEAFSIYSLGNMLFDQNGSIYAHTSGSTGGPNEHLRFIGNGIGVGQNLFALSAGVPVIGLASNPFGGINLGNAANLSYTIVPVNPAANRTINIRDPGATSSLGQYFFATSAAFAPGALAAGICSTQAATTVTGATTGMVADLTPVSDPGTGLNWVGVVASGTVAVRVCNTSTGSVTPTSTAYNIRVHI